MSSDGVARPGGRWKRMATFCRPGDILALSRTVFSRPSMLKLTRNIASSLMRCKASLVIARQMHSMIRSPD